MTTYEITANDLIEKYGKEKSVCKVTRFVVDSRRIGDKEMKEFWENVLDFIKEK